MKVDIVTVIILLILATLLEGAIAGVSACHSAGYNTTNLGFATVSCSEPIKPQMN